MKLYYLLILFIFCFTSCSKNQQQTIIKGNIPNLPDGTVYLFKDYPSNKVDSVKSINGVFKISHKWFEKEPVYIGIDHIDKKGVLRFFSFRTNAKYKGSGWGTSVFLSDSIIEIMGNLKYDTLVGIQLPPDRKPVTGPPLKAGQQTEAFYNIDGDLFDKIDSKMIQTVKEKIKKYPYS
ncbi:DUF4369 domain-containing protein, partial [Chryseobacterium sp. HMWF001]